MRFVKLCLSQPPSHLFIDRSDLPEHRREWIQPPMKHLLIVYEHTGLAYHNNISLEFSPGTMILFPPGARGAHASVGNGKLHTAFQFSLVEDSTDFHAVPVQTQLDDQRLKECGFLIHQVQQSHARGRAFIWSLLWSIAEHQRLAGTDDKLVAAERYVAQNLREPLRVDHVCQAVGVPYRSLARLFESEHGMGIQKYVAERRAREAVRLLSETSLPIKVVAARVGVPDAHQFNKLVRRSVGMSPRAVRALQS
ncbi:MAG: helix-turn-helix transcriptional regulator [Fimbriimonadaceae bacterium]|nr:helix-turn-helix transcriptional regulator [Fimbriimonadaceae bacterium]QYK55194.1 MAG: helix-turn-helix transcriptional regulator [Fimbriimonadaceae bacterium]